MLACEPARRLKPCKIPMHSQNAKGKTLQRGNYNHLGSVHPYSTTCLSGHPINCFFSHRPTDPLFFKIPFKENKTDPYVFEISVKKGFQLKGIVLLWNNFFNFNFFSPTDWRNLSSRRTMGNETFYWDGLNGNKKNPPRYIYFYEYWHS